MMNIIKNKIGWTAEQYRPYVYDLEQELKRQQNRAREHRRNIRAMQKKLDHRNTLDSIVALQREYNGLKAEAELIMAAVYPNTAPPSWQDGWGGMTRQPRVWPDGVTISCEK
jgi:hypothetical protein